MESLNGGWGLDPDFDDLAPRVLTCDEAYAMIDGSATGQLTLADTTRQGIGSVETTVLDPDDPGIAAPRDGCPVAIKPPPRVKMPPGKRGHRVGYQYRLFPMLRRQHPPMHGEALYGGTRGSLDNSEVTPLVMPD